MIDSMKSFFIGIYDHYAALTGIIFFLAIFKLIFPIFMFLLTEITNRVEEKRSVKALVKSGLTLEQAKKWSRNTWRPKRKPSLVMKLFKKIRLLFSKKSDQ